MSGPDNHELAGFLLARLRSYRAGDNEPTRDAVHCRENEITIKYRGMPYQQVRYVSENRNLLRLSADCLLVQQYPVAINPPVIRDVMRTSPVQGDIAAKLVYDWRYDDNPELGGIIVTVSKAEPCLKGALCDGTRVWSFGVAGAQHDDHEREVQVLRDWLLSSAIDGVTITLLRDRINPVDPDHALFVVACWEDEIDVAVHLGYVPRRDAAEMLEVSCKGGCQPIFSSRLVGMVQRQVDARGRPQIPAGDAVTVPEIEVIMVPEASGDGFFKIEP